MVRKINPRSHEYNVSMSFDGSPDAIQGSATFMLPLISCHMGYDDPTSVNVNHEHTSFDGIPTAGESESVTDNWYTYPNSVVKRINIKSLMNIQHQVTGITNDTTLVPTCPALRYFTHTVEWAFDNPEDYEEKTIGTDTIKNIAGIIQNAAGEHVGPNFNAIDMINTNLASTAQVVGGAGLGKLGTDQKWEGVTIDHDELHRIMKFGSLKPKMRSVFGGRTAWNEHVIFAGQPIFENIWLDVPRRVQAQNRNTYFGLLVWVPPALRAPNAAATTNENQQWYDTGAYTGLEHLEWQATINFNEHNDMFNMSM